MQGGEKIGFTVRSLNNRISSSLPLFPFWGVCLGLCRQVGPLFFKWLACYTQEEIAEKLDIAQKTVSNIIDDFTKNGKTAEIPQGVCW